MKKYLMPLMYIILSNYAFSQVGIGTETPKATLDIRAANSTGSATSTDGIIIPNVSRQRAQNMIDIENSTLIYVDDISNGTQQNIASNIDSKGFYYFNEETNKWEKISETTSSTPGTSYTFTNGITKTENTVKLGGTLSEPTTLTINNQANSLIINNSSVLEDTNNQAALIVNNGKLITDIPNAALVQFKTLPYTDTLPTTYSDGQSRAIPLYIDEEGRLVRQQTVIDQDSKNNASSDTNSSYTVNKKFDGLRNDEETIIFSSINTGTIVNFDFFTNYAYGNNQTAIIYGELSFSLKQGFKLVDWQSSGNSSTEIPTIVNTTETVNGNEVIYKVTFNYASNISGSLEIGYSNGNIYAKPIGVSGAARTIAITVINGLKIR